MPALTAAADLAIGAGGSSTWERCCLGLPTITVVLADNQRGAAAALAERGAATVGSGGGEPGFETRLDGGRRASACRSCRAGGDVAGRGARTL